MKMEGGVRKRGSSWYYYYDAGSVDGKRNKIERKGGKTKKEALNALNEALTKLRSGYVEPKKTTVHEYMTDWVENYIKENRKLNTYNRYKEIYNRHLKPYIGHLGLSEVKPIHLDQMLLGEKKKGLSGSTLQNIYGTLNSAFNRAVKLQVMYDNPLRFVDRPKRDKFIASTLAVEEIGQLFNALDTSKYSDYIMSLGLKIVLELGLRRGELAGLEWKYIDFNKQIITIANNLVDTYTEVYLTTPKTDERRDLYVSKGLMQLLKQHKVIQGKNRIKNGPHYKQNEFNDRICDFVMTWEDGTYVHPNYYTVKFNKLLKKVNFDRNIRFHDLRHTNATLLLQQGIDFKVIQTRLGHSDINTTLNIYSHVNVEMQKKATEKLIEILG